MRSDSYSLAYVDVMVDFLERRIEQGTATPDVLAALQKRLDAIDAGNRNDARFARYYPHMLELQALIYGQNNQDDKAAEYLQEAIRLSKGAKKLHSRLLRAYAASHASAGSHAAKTPARPRSWRGLFTMRRLRTAAATVVVLAVVVAGTLHFVPRVAALPMLLVKHGEISQIKQQYDTLSAQYQACSADLAQRQGTTDTNDPDAVDAYNQEVKQCQTVLEQQQTVAEHYNSLLGNPSGRQPQ